MTDFIEALFEDENILFASGANDYSGANIRLLVKNYEMTDNTDVNNLLDKCILLNTYLSCYFKEVEIINDYFISYRLDCYDNRIDFYNKDNKINFRNQYFLTQNTCRMQINSLVIQNSYAKEKFNSNISWDKDDFYNYGYIFSNLAENLKKEVSE